jgi:hypothetical protein
VRGGRRERGREGERERERLEKGKADAAKNVAWLIQEHNFS